MLTRSLLVSFAGLAFLSGCSQSLPSTETDSTPESKIELNQQKITPQTFVLAGEIVLGHEARSIQPCGSSAQYWLDISTEDYARAQTLINEPYEPVYGEVIGYLLPPGNDGFAADFDARFVVQRINVLSKEVSCNSRQVPTQAMGNEPFWVASLGQGVIDIAQLGEEAKQWKIQDQQFTLTARRYIADQGALILSNQNCRDSMSGDIFSWYAELKDNDGTSLEGCAALSNQDPTQVWTGIYLAQSNHNQGFSVELELEADHTAITRYVYTNGERAREERGFWQQLNDQQLYVTTTHHQQQPLLSERIYDLQDDKLIAKKERINGQIYTLSDGGLVLYKADPSQNSEEPEQIQSRTDFQADVDQAVRQYARSVNETTDDTKYLWLNYDLNQDGKPELLTLLNWCGNAGCKMVIFDQDDQGEWQLNTEMTLVRAPVLVSEAQHQGWNDLILSAKGVPSSTEHRLRFENGKYPLNPSVEPEILSRPALKAVLFADERSPFDGVSM
ncbi:hypothetical protein [Vibrio sp. SCSIO 43136]|uniref:hypothetical protein n=1 Tax=Vibrio sp. SCSIO 43136 TaxID=2819101 RepID=UPI002074ACFD|nr:hypothetical protein [Vibrio sp. SCSIO 43136]USD65372.1 hypothetical protein J4N39_00440 [Vibrio sp. SCSIO 43136]